MSSIQVSYLSRELTTKGDVLNHWYSGKSFTVLSAVPGRIGPGTYCTQRNEDVLRKLGITHIEFIYGAQRQHTYYHEIAVPYVHPDDKDITDEIMGR